MGTSLIGELDRISQGLRKTHREPSDNLDLWETRPVSDTLAGRRGPAAHGAMAPGVISELELYTLEEAKRRLRWTDSALRAAKRRGLNLLPSGKRRYVTGREIIRFLQADAIQG